VVHFGHDPKSRDGTLFGDSSLIRVSAENRGVHAVLVNSRAFETILAAIPDPESQSAEFAQWAGEYRSLGEFVVDAGASGMLTCLSLSPGIATNRALLRSGALESEYSRRFTL
jgi:hypothetical protein